MQPYDTTTSYKDSYSSTRSTDRLASDALSDRLSKTDTTSHSRRHTSTKKKKPITVTLVAALIGCLIAFILGFAVSSFAMLDSRLESASAKNAELQETIKQKDAEISELNSAIDKKNESNIALGEQIQEQLKTINNLQNNVQSLETDVHNIAGVALDGSETPTPVATLAKLSLSQQLILFVVLLVIIIFIISVTCSFIASKTGEKVFKKSKKSKLNKKAPKTENIEESKDEETEVEETKVEENEEGLSEEPVAENEEDEQKEFDNLADLGATREFSFDNAVNEAIDLLYHNNLEDNISDLGGFKFGITNFEEVLSNKAKGKSFGNAENGDFVAFLSTKSAVKKLYIIPRHMSLSDSSVSLRGTTDLFDIIDEADNSITHGTVKIKTIDSPAVFAFGDSGWSIESKGHITALGTKH